MGLCWSHQGRLAHAEACLLESLAIKQKVKETIWIPRTLGFLGQVYELLGDEQRALQFYQRSLDINTFNQRYYRAMVFAGLLRLQIKDRDETGAARTQCQLEEIALGQELNDLLAAMRLEQGHACWEGLGPAWGQGFAAILGFYQQALVHALRYNRFLLDEVLTGRPQGSLLRPVIPVCLSRGAQGRQMLQALLAWWQSGSNQVGEPLCDSFSPLPQGIPLLEAERRARQIEPGDGALQASVLLCLQAALGVEG